MAPSAFRLLAGAALLAYTTALPVAPTELTKPLTVEIDAPCEHTPIPNPSLLISSPPLYTPEPTVEATEEPENTPELSAEPEVTPEQSPEPEETLQYPTSEPSVSPSASPSTSSHPSASVSPVYPSQAPSTSPVYLSAHPSVSNQPSASPSASSSPHIEENDTAKCHTRNFDFKTQTAEKCCEKRFKCGSIECHGSKACENPDICYCRKPVCRKVYIHYSYHKELTGDCANQVIHL